MQKQKISLWSVAAVAVLSVIWYGHMWFVQNKKSVTFSVTSRMALAPCELYPVCPPPPPPHSIPLYLSLSFLSCPSLKIYMIFHLICYSCLTFFLKFMPCRKKKKTFWGPYTIIHVLISGSWWATLYYFYGFGECEQNNFRESSSIFREQGGIDLPWGLCEATKHLDCSSLTIHNGIRSKTHMNKGYMLLKY